MKDLRDCYRGDSLFELFRFIVSECEEVNAYGVFLFLFDNEYEVRRFTQDEAQPTGKPGMLDVSNMIMHKEARK